MSDIVQAWKNESYRQNLSVEEQGVLPANPAGEIELTQEELEAISGAGRGGFFGVPSDVDSSTAVQNGFNTFGPVSAKIPAGGIATGAFPLLASVTGGLLNGTTSSPLVNETAGDDDCSRNSQSATSNPWDLG